MSSNTTKEQMIIDSILILKSVAWTEQLINKKLLEFERAEADYKDKEAEKLRKEILGLLKRLDRENANMDVFMTKYGKLVKHEKEKMLSHSGQKD